jgi:large subunit ribosomal protein L15
MKNKIRKKGTRHRGTHTHGRGAKKKARGKGHRGGIGKAGSGKRADHKKDLTNKRKKSGYFGKDKIRRAATKKEGDVITLEQISDNKDSFVKKGVAKKTGDSYEINLKDFKVIGNSNVKFKMKINAKSASKGAMKSVKNAGGEIIVKIKRVEEVEDSGDSETQEEKA